MEGDTVPEGVTEGLRYDEGKLQIELVPPEAIIAMAEILTIGAKKYSARNWEKGMKWSKVYAPLFRHLMKWVLGEPYDIETYEKYGEKHSHMKFVLWNAMALVTYEQRGIGEDDIPTHYRT